MQHVGPPPSFNSWVHLMHLWLTFRSTGVSFKIHCSHDGEWNASHDAIQDVFTFITRNVGFHVSFEWIHVFLPFKKKLLIDGLTSFYQLMAFAFWSMLSLLIPSKHVFFHMLFHLARFSQWWWLKQKKDVTMIEPNGCISCPCYKGFWLLAPTNEQFPSSMCLHGMVNKGFWWPISRYFACFL